MTDKKLVQLESQLLKSFKAVKLPNPVKLKRIRTRRYLELGLEYIGLPSAVEYIRIRISPRGRMQAIFTKNQFDGTRKGIKMVKSRWFTNRKIFLRKIRRYVASTREENKFFKMLFERQVKE